MANAQIEDIPFWSSVVAHGQRNGRGQYIKVAATAGVDVNVKHGLNRIPPIMPELVDWPAAQPTMIRGVAAWTTSQITLQFSVTGTFTIWIR